MENFLSAEAPDEFDVLSDDRVREVFLVLQSYLRDGTLYAAITHTFKDLDLVHSDDPNVGPELDYGGNRGRWFIGIDVANTPTSRDFVLAGLRGTYTFDDGATTSGSATLTSASAGGFTSVLVGSAISGAGIPAGTTVSAVGSTTSLTLSANATATATGVNVTITRNAAADIIYLKHRGALSPTIGIGVTPPDGAARIQISAQDDEPAMGTVRLRRGGSQTGHVIAIHDSTPVDRVVVDKDFYITGLHPAQGSAVAVRAPTGANGRVVVLVSNDGATAYSCSLPTGSGNVLRIACQSGGNNAIDIGTDGSVRHVSTKLGFFAATTTTKPSVTGSRGGNAALASLITALATLGLVTDNTTA